MARLKGLGGPMKRLAVGSTLRGIVLTGLLLVIVFQLNLVVSQSLDLWRRKVAVHLHDPHVIRGADAALGGEFVRFVESLREVIPADGKVLLPPEPGRFYLTSTGIYQFFLYPRQVHVCRDRLAEPCAGMLRSGDWYVVATESFPGSNLTDRFQIVRTPFSDLDILVP